MRIFRFLVRKQLKNAVEIIPQRERDHLPAIKRVKQKDFKNDVKPIGILTGDSYVTDWPVIRSENRCSEKSKRKWEGFCERI